MMQSSVIACLVNGGNKNVKTGKKKVFTLQGGYYSSGNKNSTRKLNMVEVVYIFYEEKIIHIKHSPEVYVGKKH